MKPATQTDTEWRPAQPKTKHELHRLRQRNLLYTKMEETFLKYNTDVQNHREQGQEHGDQESWDMTNKEVL